MTLQFEELKHRNPIEMNFMVSILNDFVHEMIEFTAPLSIK